MWEKDHDVFKHCETAKEIARERKEQLKESMKTVVAYIVKMMRERQDVADCIFAHTMLGTSIFNHLLQYTIAPIHS